MIHNVCYSTFTGYTPATHARARAGDDDGNGGGEGGGGVILALIKRQHSGRGLCR